MDSNGDAVVNHYFTDDADLTLTCKIIAAAGEYTLAWLDDGMYNVAPNSIPKGSCLSIFNFLKQFILQVILQFILQFILQ